MRTLAQRSRLIWLACCVSVLVVATQISRINFVPPSGALAIESATFTYPQTQTTRVDVDRTLPDNWQWHEPQTNQGTYRATFTIETNSDTVMGVLIPTVRSNARLSLNGAFIGDGGSMTPPIASNLRRPLLFEVAPLRFNKGENSLQVQVKSSVAGKGFLDKIYVGPYVLLQPAYQQHFFFRISLVAAITYGLIITAGLMLLLAVLRPQNSEYGWFALAALCWAAHNATNHITHVAISNHVWDWFSYTTLGWFALVAPVVLARFKEKIFPRFERGLLTAAVALPLVMLLLPQREMHWVADFLWYPLAFSVGGGALLFVAIDAWKTNDVESQLLTASGLFIIPYALHDLLLVQAVLPWEHGYYIQFGAVVLLGVFASILLYRLVVATNEAEQLNLNLSAEVASKTEEIEAAMLRTRELEKREWLNTERARITRDMHDGFAGQIASALANLRSSKSNHQQLELQLEDAIHDLRLMIDSLDNEDNDLVSLLGMFRYRITPTLEQAGIALRWASLPPDRRITLAPSHALHLLRMLQESVNNVIRHADASELTINCEAVKAPDESVTVTVQDNGQGFSVPNSESASSGSHRGLRNLRYRAEQINAELRIDSSASGTQITIILPF